MYDAAKPWLVHERWQILPANVFVRTVATVFEQLGAADSVFVRPDSPLKPFSGRVLKREAVSLEALDHGYYFQDDALPVVVAPVRTIGREWRYVVVRGSVVAGSAYEASSRTSRPDTADGSPWQLASRIAAQMKAPQDVYVLDICEADGDLRLLELNPFSGADLYACYRRSVVAAVSEFARSVFE